MKKLSKVLILILAVALVCAGLVLVSSADETVIDLAAAINAATADENGMTTVTLTGDASLSETYTVDKDLTINLGGNTITSALATTFKVADGVTFKITGAGNIKLDGELFRTEKSTTANVTVAGTSEEDVIVIDHNGSKSNFITYHYDGVYNYEYLDVVTTSSFNKGKTNNEDAFFNCVGGAKGAASDTVSANITFNYVKFSAPNVVPNNPGMFIMSCAGTNSHLTITNSQIYSNSSGLYLGALGSSDKTVEIAKIENTVLSCTTKNGTPARLAAIWFERQGWGNYGAVGVVNVKDSFITSSARTLYADCCDGNDFSKKVETITVNLVGSTVSSVAPSGADVGTCLSRDVILNVDGNSRLGTSHSNGKANFEAVGKITGAVGTRVNVLKATTYNTTELAGIYLPDGSTVSSDNYTWVYDPIGDPDYPFVIAEKKDGAIVGDYSIPTTTPVYQFDYNFSEFYKVTDKSNWIVIANTYNFADLNGGMLSYSTGMQFDIKSGSILRVVNSDNQYIKYVVTADSRNGTHTYDSIADTVTYGSDDPYFIVGGNAQSSKNFAYSRDYDQVTRTAKKDANGADVKDENGNTVYTYTSNLKKRANVVVLSYDFGCDSPEGWVKLNVQTQVRQYLASEYKIDQNGAIMAFTINTDGTISYDSNMYGTNPDLKLNPIGEWNRMNVVFYTDPDIEVNGVKNGGIAHYYLNGEYMGYTAAYAPGATAHIMGTRFVVEKGYAHPKNASIAFDNISYRAYTNYLYEENDYVAATTDSAAILGKYTPENYLWSTSPARKYMGDRYAINGIAYDGAINSAIDEATSKNASLGLIADLTAPQLITTNGTVYTNGYTFNIDPDSYGAAVSYDARGNEIYTFNENYNATVPYYFYIGKDAEGNELFTDAIEYKLGNTPYYDLVNYTYAISEDGRTGAKIAQASWKTAAGEELVALTLEMIEATKATGVKVYPVYSDESTPLVAYVKNASGEVTTLCETNFDANIAYTNLADGETMVLLADVVVSGEKYFYSDAQTETRKETNDEGSEITNKYVNNVLIDNDYTEEEIASMKSVAQVLTLDLNGYTLSNNSARLVAVSNNTVFNVKTSHPGGSVMSLYLDSKGAIKGQRLVTIMHRSGAENKANGLAVFNAHINVSEGVNIIGGFPVEGNSGDNSCSMNFTGVKIIRAVADSSGAVMTRFYSGEIIVKDSMIIGPSSNQLIDMKGDNGKSGNDYSVEAAYKDSGISPYVEFDNCMFISKGGRNNLIGNNGYGIDSTCLVFKDCTYNGRFNGSNGSRTKFDYGNAALYMAGGSTLNDDNVIAYTNVGMTMGEYIGEDVHYLKIVNPVLNNGAINFNNYYYIVDYGYLDEFKAENPDVADSSIIELPLLTQIMVPKSETVTVKYEKVDGTSQTTQTYVKGGNLIPVRINTGTSGTDPEIVADSSMTVGSLLIKATGWILPESKVVNDDIVIKPTYTVSSGVSGVKANLSLYSDFCVNIYIPAEFKDYITSITDGENVLGYTEVAIGDKNYIKVSVSRTVAEAANTVNLTIATSQEFNGQVYDTTANVKISIVDYAEIVLTGDSYTAEDKTLMWYMLNYIFEGMMYFTGTENSTVTNLINTYADYNNQEISKEFGAAVDEIADLAAVFTGATIQLNEAPAFVFIPNGKFAGNVTVNYGNVTRTYTVRYGDTAPIVVEGMKIHSFAGTVGVTARGFVLGANGEQTVTGFYSLDAFAKYHTENADFDEESAACLPLINALYDYVKVAEAYKNGELDIPADDTVNGDTTTEATPAE